MNSEAEDWLLRLCRGMALNFFSGWFPTLSIASLWPAKLFEEELKAWKSVKLPKSKQNKPNARTSSAPHLFGKHSELLCIQVKCSTFPSTPNFLFYSLQLRFFSQYQLVSECTVFKVVPTRAMKCPGNCQVAAFLWAADLSVIIENWGWFCVLELWLLKHFKKVCCYRNACCERGAILSPLKLQSVPN